MCQRNSVNCIFSIFLEILNYYLRMPPIKVTSTTGDVNDGDVSGAESEHSNTSHENDGGRDSSEDEADSDDSSEMDEGKPQLSAP